MASAPITATEVSGTWPASQAHLVLHELKVAKIHYATFSPLPPSIYPIDVTIVAQPKEDGSLLEVPYPLDTEHLASLVKVSEIPSPFDWKRIESSAHSSTGPKSPVGLGRSAG